MASCNQDKAGGKRLACPELEGPAVPKEEMKLPTDTKAAAKGTLKDEG